MTFGLACCAVEMMQFAAPRYKIKTYEPINCQAFSVTYFEAGLSFFAKDEEILVYTP